MSEAADTQANNEQAAMNMINMNTDDELRCEYQRDGWHVERANGEVLGQAAKLDDAIVAALAGKSRVARAHRWALGQALSLSLDSEGVLALYADDDEDEDDQDNDSEDGVTVRRE